MIAVLIELKNCVDLLVWIFDYVHAPLPSGIRTVCTPPTIPLTFCYPSTLLCFNFQALIYSPS